MVAGLLIYQIRISQNVELLSVLKGHRSKQSFVSRIEDFFYTEANLMKKSMYKLLFLHRYFVLLHFR